SSSDLTTRNARDYFRKLLERNIYSVITNPPLRKIVGADALGTIARSHLSAALRGAFSIALLALEVVESGAQHRHRLGAISVLRAVLLHHHDDAGRNVSDADSRFCLVDVLSA